MENLIYNIRLSFIQFSYFFKVKSEDVFHNLFSRKKKRMIKSVSVSLFLPSPCQSLLGLPHLLSFTYKEISAASG